MPTVRGPIWTLDVKRDRIDVTSERETPNESWRFTDANGHEHHYERGYPTLRFVIDAQHWCDGTEGFFNHDPHMAVDGAHYECAICGLVIVPAVDPPYTPKFIDGITTAELRAFRDDGVEIVMQVSGEQVDRLRHLSGPEVPEEIHRLVNNAPPEVILSDSSDRLMFRKDWALLHDGKPVKHYVTQWFAERAMNRQNRTGLRWRIEHRTKSPEYF